jgi:ATP-dependent metalloprotease FtsH
MAGETTRRPEAVGGGRRLRSSLGFWAATIIAVLIVAYIGLIEASRPHVDGDPLRLDGFDALVEQERIVDATFLDQDAYVVGRYRREDGTVARFNVTYLKSSITSREALLTRLIEDRVPIRIDQQFAKQLIGPATTLLPALILTTIFIYFILSARAGSGPFGRRGESVGRRVDSGDIRFRDVAGQDEAVAELREVSDFLADPQRYAALGAQVPRGILLFGPPGCGKTLMARALAGEAGAAFYSISGSDFVEMYVGVGAARVRELFADAREHAPAIVFIDELDSLGRRRAADGPGGQGGSAEEQGQALNQLLTQIDGFSPTQGIIVVAATNRPDVLDPALLRPGRFDRAVGLRLPDLAGREAILRVHARSKALAPGADLAAIARDAVGMTGADLAAVVNEAALLTARDRRGVIGQADLERALGRIRDAPEQQRRLSMRDRRVGQGRLSGERVTFADVAGLADAVDELAEVRDFLVDRTRYERLGARVPSGFLLAGPPGTGKTLLAHALAGEANAAFLSAAGTEFVETYIGEGAARVRDLFAEARSVAPAIVFIDELDAIGAVRGTGMSDSSERMQTLNQLLVELDASHDGADVIVVGATNRPELLDPALMRPGRFDRTLALDLPDLDARRELLALHAGGRRLDAGVDLDAVARATYGLSGADLANILNEAALLAARRGHDSISRACVEEAMDRVGLGIADRRQLSDADRLVVAYHEAGHALVARALPGGRILRKVSIVRRGASAGATWLPETDDRRLHSRSLLVERMATLLGGRAAEQLVFGEVTGGAAGDLAAVSGIAHRMVTELGMSDGIGAVRVGHGHSEETARRIDQEIRRLVDEADGQARAVLTDGRAALDRVAHALLDRETLSLEDVEAVLADGPTAAAAARA